jgi:Lrp/AsnC family transcriptional regulator, leucine-responsive regulatory protein
MDTIDRRLLVSLQENCKLSLAELSSRVGAAISTVSDRLKKLQATGVIHGNVALLSPRGVGLDVCAFVHVLTDRPENELVFLARVLEMPEVQECHHITGEFSYLLKLRSRTTAHLEALLAQIKPLPGVLRTSTVIVLSSPKETTVLPLYDME